MRQERIALMPDWPARMGDDMAANYLGVGITMFRERVKRREYPQPVREGTRLLWSRQQLDRFVAAQFGLPIDAGDAMGASNDTWGDL